MMNTVWLVCVLATCLPLVFCIPKGNLGPRPWPMKGLKPNKVVGRWYHQARVIPCDWQGSRGFTNMARDFELGKNALIAKTMYRIGNMCTSLTDQREFKECYAVQMTRDQIGNVYSSDTIFVATDYKRFLITWGCLRYSQLTPNYCDDPTLSVQTRERFPTQQTLTWVDAILDKLFQLKLVDMEAMPHDNPCPEN